VLQCVAVCCSVLQCGAVCCSVLQCVAVRCSVLQCVAVCCSVLPRVVVYCSGGRGHASAVLLFFVSHAYKYKAYRAFFFALNNSSLPALQGVMSRSDVAHTNRLRCGYE